MKVENRDTTIRKPTRKSFKKGNTKNVNKYQTLFYNVRTYTCTIVSSFNSYCTYAYAYLLITKLLKILIFAHGEHKKKLIRMYSILFYITNLVCYTYFHWFFNPECQHIFEKQTGYIFQSPTTIKTWTTKQYASLNQWYNTE